LLSTWASTVIAIIAAIGAIAFVATAWGFFPIGLIVLLTAGLLGALWVLHKARGTSPTTDHRGRQHDERIVSEVRNLIARRDIEWLKTWDFGGSWRAASVQPFHDLHSLDDVEHRPIDADLGAALRRLFDTSGEFANLLAYNSFFERMGGDERWRNVGWSGGEADGLEGDERRLWQERRDLLNAAADPVAEAYDDFIEVARRELLLAEQNPE
jgi:hypothetical protein